MPDHRTKRRTAREWARDDLKGMNRPGEIVVTLRSHPRILVRGLMHLVMPLAVVAIALAIFGAFDRFGEWWWLAFIHAGLAIGRDVGRHKQPVARTPGSAAASAELPTPRAGLLVVKARLEDDKVLKVDEVHQAMLLSDPA